MSDTNPVPDHVQRMDGRAAAGAARIMQLAAESANPVPAPTPADMERDLAADLAIVEYAPPGPWYHDPANLWAMVTTQPDGGGGFVARALPVTVSCRRYGERETAAAIAAMRGAWPAAIRRALHAEAECERLRDTMRRAANAIRLGLTVTGIKSKGLETIADALLREGDANG